MNRLIKGHTQKEIDALKAWDEERKKNAPLVDRVMSDWRTPVIGIPVALTVIAAAPIPIAILAASVSVPWLWRKHRKTTKPPRSA